MLVELRQLLQASSIPTCSCTPILTSGLLFNRPISHTLIQKKDCYSPTLIHSVTLLSTRVKKERTYHPPRFQSQISFQSTFCNNPATIILLLLYSSSFTYDRVHNDGSSLYHYIKLPTSNSSQKQTENIIVHLEENMSSQYGA